MYLSDEIRIAKMFMGPPIILILIPILVLGCIWMSKLVKHFIQNDRPKLLLLCNTIDQNFGEDMTQHLTLLVLLMTITKGNYKYCIG